MKRTLILALMSLLVLGCQGDKTIFEGRFIGYNNEYVEFFLQTPEGEYVEVPFEVNPDGTFKAELEFERNEYDARLFADKFMFCTCVEKGKKYNVEFNLTDPSDETNFRFFGEGEKENEFTRDFWNGWGFDYAYFESLSAVGNFKEYKAVVDNAADAYIARIEQTGNRGFIDFYTRKIDEFRIKYTMYYPYLMLGQTGKVNEDADFEAWRNTDPYSALDGTQMAAAYNMTAGMLLQFPEADMLQVLQIARRCSSNEVICHNMMTNIFYTHLQAGLLDNLQEAYAYYREIVTNPALYTQIMDIYEAGKLLGKGAQAPEIEFADIDGNVKNLASLRGKALYIDLWATWCRPCCQEIPYMEKLVEQLGNDPDILCVSISLDQDLDAWKEKVKNDKPAWPQFVATASGQDAVNNKYHVGSIPRFMLLDKDGKIITVDAPRPSTLDVSSLKALLK